MGGLLLVVAALTLTLLRPATGRPARPARPRKADTQIMAPLLTIGEFSRMTHLSVKALRHYHDMGVLEPAAIDPFTGYRSYDAEPGGSAQVIRRLRDLGMPLDSITAVLAAPDLEARNREIAAHLGRMERQLEQTQASVAALRALLAGPAVRPAIEFRTIPAVTALAVARGGGRRRPATWGSEAFGALSAALAKPGVAPAAAPGPFGALFPGDFFELERSEITAFVPVGAPPAASGRWRGRSTARSGCSRSRRSRRRSRCTRARSSEIDRTYGALGRWWPSAPSAWTARSGSTT